MGRLYPGALSWWDYSTVVATRRSAVPLEHRHRAESVFRIERKLRLGGRVVQQWVGLPAALSIWGKALEVWRSCCAAPGFDLLVAEEQTPLLVDCLLSVATVLKVKVDSSESPFYNKGWQLRCVLKARHTAEIFGCVEADLCRCWQSQF